MEKRLSETQYNPITREDDVEAVRWASVPDTRNADIRSWVMLGCSLQAGFVAILAAEPQHSSLRPV